MYGTSTPNSNDTTGPFGITPSPQLSASYMKDKKDNGMTIDQELEVTKRILEELLKEWKLRIYEIKNGRIGSTN